MFYLYLPLDSFFLSAVVIYVVIIYNKKHFKFSLAELNVSQISEPDNFKVCK